MWPVDALSQSAACVTRALTQRGGCRRGTPTGGSGRATPEESSISVPEVAGVGGETAGAEGDPPDDDDDDDDDDFTPPEPICGGRWRDKAHLKEWMKDLLEEPTTSTPAKVRGK